MTSPTQHGFMETFVNGVFSVEHLGDGTFKLWVASNEKLSPYIFNMGADELEILANNLLEAARRAGQNVG